MTYLKVTPQTQVSEKWFQITATFFVTSVINGASKFSFSFIFHIDKPFARWRYFNLLLRPESFRYCFSSANYGFCYLNLAGITKFKYERKIKKDSGSSSRMTLSCKWPINQRKPLPKFTVRDCWLSSEVKIIRKKIR